MSSPNQIKVNQIQVGYIRGTSTTEDDVSAYFSSFGEIQKIETIVSRDGTSSGQISFKITFKDPEVI